MRLPLTWSRSRIPTHRQADLLGDFETAEILYGGAAGGGKSDALLMAALQFVDQPGYSAILFRRTFADLALSGALIPRSRDWLANTPAIWNQQTRTWRFPSGATLSFGYLDHEDDRYRYQGSEFQFIGFDELTQFHESDYTYLFSRLRRRQEVDVPLRMRAASNPGGVGHDWVKRRFLSQPESSRRFIASRLDDNPYLDREAYRDALSRLDPVVRDQLLSGNWDAADDRLLTVESIQAAEHAKTLWTDDEKRDGDLYVGVDIGRSRDLSVVWTFERVGDVFWTREIKVMAGVDFQTQKAEIKRRLTRTVVRAFIDKGGIGMQLAEELEREHRGVVEGVQLTSGNQGRLAQQISTELVGRRIRIPVDPILRDDWRLVRRIGDRSGLPVIETERRHGVGHADRFWAAALALDAALWTAPRGARRGPVYR